MPRRLFERVYPRVGALLVLAVWAYLKGPSPHVEFQPVALVGSITLASIILGFASASVSILVGLNSPVMDKIRQSGSMVIVEFYVAECIRAGLLVTVCAFAGFFLGHPMPALLSCLWVAALAFLLLSFHRLSRIMLGLLVANRHRR